MSVVRLLLPLFVLGSVLAPPSLAASGPPYSDFTYERVRVPMRDGVELSVDIWRPVTPPRVKVPVILSMTPYHVLYKALDANEENFPSGDAQLFVPKVVPGPAGAALFLRGPSFS